jgi:hypothetical protein
MTKNTGTSLLVVLLLLISSSFSRQAGSHAPIEAASGDAENATTLFRASEGCSAVIFDTDLDSDVDDVGALAVLHALANRGETLVLYGGQLP